MIIAGLALTLLDFPTVAFQGSAASLCGGGLFVLGCLLFIQNKNKKIYNLPFFEECKENFKSPFKAKILFSKVEKILGDDDVVEDIYHGIAGITYKGVVRDFESVCEALTFCEMLVDKNPHLNRRLLLRTIIKFLNNGLQYQWIKVLEGALKDHPPKNLLNDLVIYSRKDYVHQWPLAENLLNKENLKIFEELLQGAHSFQITYFKRCAKLPELPVPQIIRFMCLIPKLATHIKEPIRIEVLLGTLLDLIDKTKFNDHNSQEINSFIEEIPHLIIDQGIDIKWISDFILCCPQEICKNAQQAIRTIITYYRCKKTSHADLHLLHEASRSSID